MTKEFLDRHGLVLLIRSHECKPEGYEFTHENRVSISVGECVSGGFVVVKSSVFDFFSLFLCSSGSVSVLAFYRCSVLLFLLLSFSTFS